MSHDEMKRTAEAYWATHERVGVSSAQGAAAVFSVQGLTFDNDGNFGTQVDTARIMAGESVLWQWVEGFHTVTSGSGSGDPQSGVLFDQPSDEMHPQFTFTYDNAGTFPFYCAFHEGFNMKGVVVVSNPTGVDPRAGDRRALGFTAAPWPNPTRSGVSFQFALGTAGRARVEVFDARGRLCAVVLDGDLPSGSHAATWSGRSGTGRRAEPGIYYLRLRVPGLTDDRRVVVAR